MDKTSVKQRLIEFIKKKNLRIANFERNIGMSEGYVHKLKSLGADNLLKIKEEYPDINLNWLITGEEQMLKPEPMVMDKGLTVEKLTKREYFAGLAMQAALTARLDNEDCDLDWEYDDNYNWDRSHAQYIGHYAVIARHAVNFADALLEELSK